MKKNVNMFPKNGDLWNRSRKSNVIRENYDDFSENVRKITIFEGKFSTFVFISSWIFYKNPKFLIPRKVWMAVHRSFFAVSAGSIVSQNLPLKRAEILKWCWILRLACGPPHMSTQLF